MKNIDRAMSHFYALKSDHHRDQAMGHLQEAKTYPKFSTVRQHNESLADLHDRLSSEYALLSGVHQTIDREEMVQ